MILGLYGSISLVGKGKRPRRSAEPVACSPARARPVSCFSAGPWRNWAGKQVSARRTQLYPAFPGPESRRRPERPQEWNRARAGCAAHRWAGPGPASMSARERSTEEKRSTSCLLASLALSSGQPSAVVSIKKIQLATRCQLEGFI